MVFGRLILDLTQSFLANKNWNSHGNAVYAAMYNTAILLSALNKKTSLPVNFIQKLPKGVALGGQKHGWHETHYVKFMMNQVKCSPITGSLMLIWIMGTFIKTSTMNRLMRFSPGKLLTLIMYLQDQCGKIQLTYRGTHLLDGECKSTDNEGHKILDFSSTQQLAWKSLQYHSCHPPIACPCSG